MTADDSQHSPRVKLRGDALTSDLPKLIGHWKIPVLKPSVRKESGLEKDETYDDKKPECYPKISY